MARAQNTPWIDPAEWPVNQYQLTYPQRQVLGAIPRFVHTAFIAGNRVGKTEFLFWLFIQACLGKFACDACGSTGRIGCPGCHGTSWAPHGSNFAIISLSREQGRAALQDKINQFALSLPFPQILKSKTTREGLTNPLIFAHPDDPNRMGATLSIRTEGQHWRQMQGAEYAGVGFDEQPDEAIWKEMQFRQKPGVLTRYLYTMTPTNGIDWFYRDFIATNRPDTFIQYASIFENGIEPCQTCHKNRAQWDAELTRLEYPLAKRGLPDCAPLCPRCRTYGVEPRMTQAQMDHLQRSAKGEELMMRLYGHFIDVGMDKCFTYQEQRALRAAVKPPKKAYGGRGIFLEPQPRRAYVLGCDTSEGIGRDESVVTLLDAHSGEQVCCWGDNKTEPHGVVLEILDVQEVYARALICVEAMSTGTGVIDTLKGENVRLYEHRSPWATPSRPTKKRFGYKGGPTGSEFLKRQLIDAIKRTFQEQPDGSVHIVGGRENCVYVHDTRTVEQLCLLAYDPEDHNKVKTPRAYHDDRVMALALAHEARQTRRRWQAGDSETPTADKYREYEDWVIAQHQKKRVGHVYGPAH